MTTLAIIPSSGRGAVSLPMTPRPSESISLVANTRSQSIERAFGAYREEIERHLNVPANLILHTYANWPVFGTAINMLMLPGLDQGGKLDLARAVANEMTALRYLNPDASHWMEFYEFRSRDGLAFQHSTSASSRPSYAHTFYFAGIPVCLLTYSHAVFSQESEYCHPMLFMAMADAPKFFEQYARLVSATRKPYLCTYEGRDAYTELPVAPTQLDNMVLSPAIQEAVVDDMQNFFDNRNWFDANDLPYKRGYLLQGPPGNGKTSLVRALMSKWNLTAHTPQLRAKDMNDAAFIFIVDRAVRNGPALLLLEDLDRAFPKGANQTSQVSLEQLLNSLDGVTTNDGLITIATANEPENLDPAILTRPQRFDRIVHFDNPTDELRAAYFKRRNVTRSEEEMAEIVAATVNFSFTQLQECFVSSGSKAFNREDKTIYAADICEAAETLRKSIAPSRKSQVKGFHQ